MAGPTYSTDLATILLDFPSTSSWQAIGGGASGLNAPETDYFIQGNNCITKNAWASAAKGMIYNFGSGITLPTDGAVIMWIAHATMNSVDPQSSGGLQLLVGSASGSYNQWYVGGSDTEVFGFWNAYPVNTTVSADATTGSPSGTLQYFGAVASLTGGPTKGAPFAIDAIRYGRCIMQVTNGEIDDYANLAGLETTGNGNTLRWGLLQFIRGTYFMQGFLSMGLAGTAVDWRDSNRVINILDTTRVTSAFNRFEVINSSSNVEWTNYIVTSLGTTSRGTWITSSGTVTMNRCQFKSMGTFTFLSTDSWIDCVWDDCETIVAPGSDLTGSSIREPRIATDNSSLIWNAATDTDGLLDKMTFVKGSAAHHAIEFGASSPLTQTVRGWTTSGFNVDNDQNDSTFYFADRGSDSSWTVNVVGGTGNFSYKKARSADAVTIVVDPVTILVNVKNNIGDSLQDARVILRASNETGDLPFNDIVTITRSGSVASVSHTAHGMMNNDKVYISGSDQHEYNGAYTISNVTTNAYDYTISGTPTTPATGTIKATGIILEGTTDASGNISALRSFSSDQPVEGVVRKATVKPFFKSFNIAGTVDNVTGLTINVRMILDE